jgi:hypothetical protein
MLPKVTKFKCCKCAEWKVKDAFDEREFTDVRPNKVCLKCEIKQIKNDAAIERMKAEMDANKKLKKAENQVQYIQSLKFPAKTVLPNTFKSDKYGAVWMRKDDPFNAYKLERGKYIKYRNVTCQFTGKTKIVVDWKYGGQKWYTLEQMYRWIWD